MGTQSCHAKYKKNPLTFRWKRDQMWLRAFFPVAPYNHTRLIFFPNGELISSLLTVSYPPLRLGRNLSLSFCQECWVIFQLLKASNLSINVGNSILFGSKIASKVNLSAIFLQASQQQKEHAAVEGNTHLMSTLDKMKRENDSFASFDTFFTGPAAN